MKGSACLFLQSFMNPCTMHSLTAHKDLGSERGTGQLGTNRICLGYEKVQTLAYETLLHHIQKAMI
jgi:hypothetical protein